MNSLEVLKTCIMYPEYALQISGFEMIQVSTLNNIKI